jgi:hypothetical protein
LAGHHDAGYYFDPDVSQKKISDYAKYVTAPSIGTHHDVIKTYHDDKLTREQKWSYKELKYSEGVRRRINPGLVPCGRTPYHA